MTPDSLSTESLSTESLGVESLGVESLGTESLGAADRQEFTVLGFDHLVLQVRDVEASLRFYVDTLGLEGTRVAEWRAGKVPFPSVRITPQVVIDLDGREPPTGSNMAHFCLEINEVALDALSRRTDLVQAGGPVRRWGARGEADLIYIKDPDDNTIELRHYGPSQGFGYHEP